MLAVLVVLGALASSCGGAAEPRESATAATAPTPLPWHHPEPPPLPHEPLSVVVASIVDGDTITVTALRQEVTIRLLGIDTPEKSGGPRPAECFGAEATDFLAELLPVGSAVTVSRDRETRDQYGRLLGWLHRPDGVFINLAMVESGHATALFFAPNDGLKPLFERAGHAARRDQRGFWATCGAADVVLADP